MVSSARPEQKLGLTMSENGNLGLAMISIDLDLVVKCYRYEVEEGNKSSKDCTWSAVPDALHGVIAEEME